MLEGIESSVARRSEVNFGSKSNKAPWTPEPEIKTNTLVMFYKQHCTGDTSLTFSNFESRCLVVA